MPIAKDIFILVNLRVFEWFLMIMMMMICWFSHTKRDKTNGYLFFPLVKNLQNIEKNVYLSFGTSWLLGKFCARPKSDIDGKFGFRSNLIIKCFSFFLFNRSRSRSNSRHRRRRHSPSRSNSRG